MARIVGPFLAIVGAAVALRAVDLTLLMPGFFQDGPLLLITGAFTLALGLIMVAAHNVWDSPPAIVISLIGWITTVRGALLLLAPNLVTTLAPYVVHSSGPIMIIGVITALIGAWLAFVGWLSKSV